MKCERCGWDGLELPPLPASELLGVPLPPLPRCEVHPETCPLPFSVGSEVFWDGGGCADDLPPIRGVFEVVTEFSAPHFALSDNGWEKLCDGAPVTARIKIDRGSLLPEHYERFETLDADTDSFQVSVEDVTPIERWPTLT